MGNKFLGLNSINVLKDYIDKHIEEEFDRIEIENTEGTIIMPEISIIKDEEDGNSYWAVDGDILEVDGERCRANGDQGPEGPQGIDGRPADVITEKYSLGSVTYPFIPKNNSFLSKEELPEAKVHTVTSYSEVRRQEILNLPQHALVYVEESDQLLTKTSLAGNDYAFAGIPLTDALGMSLIQIFPNNNKIYIWRVLGTQQHIYDEETGNWVLDESINWSEPKRTEYIQGLPGPQGPKGEPGEGVTPMISVDHTSLFQMITVNALTPGQQYRIIDFVTTCNQQGAYDSNVTTSSAGHQFDIIVTADTVNTLNANARVCLHEFEDTTPDEVSKYFVNNKLSEWKIKYDINNDTTKYKWAAENGKGVIYWMQDEFGNEACYDFKNIVFNERYTFDLYINNTHTDFSLLGTQCFENKIKAYYVGLLQYLNNNLCLSTTNRRPIALNIFGTNTHSCIINTFSKSNHIGYNCSYININQQSNFINVLNNIYGTSTEIINIDGNGTYATITVAKNSNGEIVRYCEADLAALLLAPEQTQE